MPETDAANRFDAEKFNALMKLADFRYQRWRERRSTDWKISLALWTLLVGAASYLIANKIRFKFYVGAPFLITLVVCHALFWVRTNWISNQMDILTAFHFAESARILVNQYFIGPIEPRRHPKAIEECQEGLKFLSAGFLSDPSIHNLFLFPHCVHFCLPATESVHS
jgi:hypothetical protein